jgi:hypothetical protein
MWKLTWTELWKDGVRNPELDSLLKDGYEPFATVSNVYGSAGGSFIGGVGEVKSQVLVLFRKGVN